MIGKPGLGGDGYDDPSSVINSMSATLNAMGFVADFAPIKLRQGWGEPVCRVLNFLSDQALKAKRFAFASPAYPADLVGAGAGASAAGMAAEDDGGEDDEIEEEVPGAIHGEEEALYTEAPAAGPSSGSAAAASSGVAEDESSRRPAVDRAVWEQEVERMGPRLRTRASASGREWRSHLEQTSRHHKTISTLRADAAGSLAAVNAEVSAALTRVADKERFLNATLTGLLGEHEKAQARATQLEGEHRQRTSAVAALTSEIGQMADDLEDAKARMDEHGSSMTDQAPLVRIKAALGKLRAESRALDLRVGVTGHSVMQRKLHASAKQAAGEQDAENGGSAWDEEGEDGRGEDASVSAAGRRRGAY